MIVQEQEDIICFFCHQTSFQYGDLQVYRLCPCSPSSPLICTYCCLSKEKLFCPECGMFFDKHILSQKASYLKNLEVKQKKISQFNAQYKNNFESQFFAQPLQNQASIPCQQIPNYQQLNYINMQQNYGQSFVNEMYQQQQNEQELRSRINMKMGQTNPNLGLSLANSLYQSPIKCQNTTNSDFNIFDPKVTSFISSTNESDSNKFGQFSSQPSSQKSDWSQQKNIEQNMFCSIQSNCYKNQNNIEYFNQQNTINQPWIFNQQQQQPQQIKQNQFQKNDKQFFTNIFEQPKTQQVGFAFPQNIQNQQQQIYNSFQNFQMQPQNNTQQQTGFEQKSQPQTIPSQKFTSPKIEQNEMNQQLQQQYQLSQQSTILDEETVERINNFSFQNSNTQLEQSGGVNYIDYLQKVPQSQKIKTHLHQSLDPSMFQKQIKQENASLNSSQVSLNSSGFGQHAEYFQQAGNKSQNIKRSNSVQLSQSLSLNEISDRTLNKSFSLQDKPKKQQNINYRSHSNKDLAQYFRSSRSNSKYEGQQNKVEEPIINEEQILQFKKEQEQMLFGRDFFMKSQQQQQINNQAFLNSQNKNQFMSNNNLNQQMNNQLAFLGNMGNNANNIQVPVFNNNSNQFYFQSQNNMFAQYLAQGQSLQQPQIPFQPQNVFRNQEGSPFQKFVNQNQIETYNQQAKLSPQIQQYQCMQQSQMMNFKFFSNNQMEEM